MRQKWCATFWDPRAPDLVALNCQILSCHDFWNSWKVTSSQNTSKLVLGPPKGPNAEPQGSPPMGSLGLPRVPLPWWVRDPFHGIPWAPKGSLSHGSPPMGSLWAQPIPFRFAPLHPMGTTFQYGTTFELGGFCRLSYCSNH